MQCCCQQCDVCDAASFRVYRCLGSDTKPVCGGWFHGRTRVCRYRMCISCWQRWYLEHQKTSCPQCRRDHTFPGLHRLKQTSSAKVIPDNIVVADNIVDDNEVWWESIDFPCCYHVFVCTCTAVMFLVALIVILVAACQTDNRIWCAHCLVLTVVLVGVVLVHAYLSWQRVPVREEMVLVLSLVKMFLLLAIMIKKYPNCSWQNTAVFLWLVFLCPCMSWLNFKIMNVKDKEDASFSQT